MANCLGINIQKNLIKYAKIAKDHNNFKVEAYGVKFYDADLEKTIEQIVKETFSYQIPISVNIEKEEYTYANIFNLLKPQDVEKSIDTEFDFFCSNNNKNRNSLEYRRLKGPNPEDRDKIRVMYTYMDKANIVERMQLLDKYKVDNLSPTATVIPNINKTVFQDNCMIVNIEEETEVTTIANGAIYKVDKIKNGMEDILNSIAERENSIQRAYEICKNTTVYTKSGQNLKIEGNEYLEEIITALLEIIEKVRELVMQSEVEINSIYLSGMGLIINNIDLLFQENFIDKKCEILVPYFVEKTNVKINIKDYIEVNSAIAIALQGLDTKNQDTNFSTRGKKLEDVMRFLNSDVSKMRTARVKKEKTKIPLKDVINSELDFVEVMLVRAAVTLILIMMLYITATELLANSTNKKIEEAKKTTERTVAEITNVTNYNSMIKSKTNEYQKTIDDIDKANAQISENYSSKNAIPNLLTKIMFNVPTGVQILLIENPTGKNVNIVAQASKYDQLGYFKAVLEEEGILKNITTTNAKKQTNRISITIKGELNY